jgi:hypothetical protein
MDQLTILLGCHAIIGSMLIFTGMFIAAGDELQSVFTICIAMATQ